MSNIQTVDTNTQMVATKINNALTDIMDNSQSWKFFMSKLPAAKQQQIPNDVFSYVTLHADTVKDLNYNEFMACVVECYSQGYTLADGDGFVLPFWSGKEKRNVARFIRGYMGVQRRAMETGLFRYFTVSKVYKGSIKGYNHRRGIPIFNEEFIPKGTEEVIGYFGYYEMYSGAVKEIYCSVESLEQHAIKYSPQSHKAEQLAGTWRDAFDAMCQKTMYLKLGKLAPKVKNPTEQQSQFFDYVQAEEEMTAQLDRPKNIDGDGVVYSQLKCAVCGKSINDTEESQGIIAKYGVPLCSKECKDTYLSDVGKK